MRLPLTPLARPSRRGALLALVFLATVSTPLAAQERELAWPEIAVTAHLEADGTLRVRERQEIRFTGDWNGGERRFDLRFGQRFTFDGMARLDTATGLERPLVEGSLDDVDGYRIVNGSTVRWRSRTPDAPPFDGTLLTYVLSFHYRDILDVGGDGGYTLNHDFAFADREGELTRFTLTLTLDSAWRAGDDFVGRYEAGPLLPYEGYTVRVPLTRVGGGTPSAVRTGAPRAVRVPLLLLVVMSGAGVLGWVVRHARARGQLAPLLSESAITPEWLTEHVLQFPAEVIGAAYDGRVGEAEVAATLARMVQERKLSSRVESSKTFGISRHVLHLELEVRREKLSGYEEALVSALFSHDSRHTDTDAVRARYKKSGFDPANVIKAGVMSRAQALATDVGKEMRTQAWRGRLLVTLALAAAAIGALVTAFMRNTTEGGVTLAMMGVSLFELFIGLAVAAALRDRATGFGASIGVLAFFTVEMTVLGAWLFLGHPWRLGTAALLAVALWMVTIVHAIGSVSLTTLSADRIALRKRLAAARAWFEAELTRPEPRLVDAWYPYMLALGLGKHVDKWFKAFGGEVTRRAGFDSTPMMSSSSSGGGSSSGGAAPFTGFGGGGGFSGGGGGVSFGAAIGSIASSVPSPSSSSSSGGSSSSSSSSGGGGGGGW